MVETPTGARGSIIRMLLIAIGAVGFSAVSSSARAAPLTVAGAFLYYASETPSILFGAGGDPIGQWVRNQ
jgi:hypothetical protein